MITNARRIKVSREYRCVVLNCVIVLYAKVEGATTPRDNLYRKGTQLDHIATEPLCCDDSHCYPQDRGSVVLLGLVARAAL